MKLRGKTIDRVEVDTKTITYCEHINRGGGSTDSEVPHRIVLHFTDGSSIEFNANATGSHYKYENDPYISASDIREG